MNIDLALCGFETDEPVPESPASNGFVSMNDAFENVDYAIPTEADADSVIMKLPQGRIAKTTRSRMKSCATPAQLRELDRELYASVGLNPRDFGI
jgi:hypothetical protein